MRLPTTRGLSSFAGPATPIQSMAGHVKLPRPIANEPFLHYAPGSPERAKLREEVTKLENTVHEIPCFVNGKAVYTGNVQEQRNPSNHDHLVCKFHTCTPELLNEAIEGALEAKKKFEAMPLETRLAIFKKAADLLSTKYRAELCAAVMCGTGKNVWQAEIDASVETIDFWRIGAAYAEEIFAMQPPINDFGVWNRLEYRPLEGFIACVTPFNFIAIGANLPSSPALMGNVSIWKPSSSAIHSHYVLYKILEEAGLPPGVMQFLPGSGGMMGDILFNHEEFAGLHFTGSTAVFNDIYRTVANNLETFKSYPRIVGETGGKNFHFVHPSADMEHVAFSTLRGAFEYQGQKCSATSRMYIPRSRYDEFKERILPEVAQIKMGDPTDFSVFMCAVINEGSFKTCKRYLDHAAKDPSCTILAGGGYDDSKGWFVEPTIIETTNPHYQSMTEEIFGPILTVYVYEDDDIDQALELCDTSTEYGLTGSIFAQDSYAIAHMSAKLRNAAGNFYINDKSTGSIVGQQPFGGARASGTNDKSGSLFNLLRWTSVRSIKETMVPTTGWRYPSMSTEP